ncbi:MAG: CoA-disulfide reductase [Fusobacteriaceae bacterium]
MKVIIVGGVAAGMSAAAKAIRLNKEIKITVYEKTNVVAWGSCGLPYYVGNFFDNPNNMIARTPDKLIESGINLKINHAVLSVNINSKKITVKNLESGEIFEDSYDKLMIATGASAIIPPLKNIELKNISTLKEYIDGENLREIAMKDEIKNVVIIGAGYIGIEAVEAMHNLGKKSIRLIQLGSRVLPESFDKEITDIMEQELKSYDNISLHLSETVKEFEGLDGKVCGVITDKEKYPADLVIISVGIKPNTEFLRNTGIKMLSNGAIIIDEHGETSITDIFSAGDCATVFHSIKEEDVYIPLATTANKIGRIVGENIAGVKTKFSGTLGSACVKVMGLETARTGISEEEAKNKNFNYKTIFIKDKNHTNYYPDQFDIWVKLIYDANSRIILGGQMIGKQGTVLRVDVLAAAIYSKMTVDELGMLDLCYSPPYSRTWDVLNIVGNAAK